MNARLKMVVTPCFTFIAIKGLLSDWLKVRVLLRSSVSKELLNIPVEQLLSMCRFENRSKLDDFGVKIDTNTPNFGD